MDRRRVNRLSVIALATGMTAAGIIYLCAKPPVLDPLLGDPLNNKKYIRELRVMGGRANVAAAEFQAWFDGLWEGESLAGTVAVLTVAGVLLFRFVALLPPAPPSTRDPGTPPPAA